MILKFCRSIGVVCWECFCIITHSACKCHMLSIFTSANDTRPFQGIIKARCKIKIGCYAGYSVEEFISDVKIFCDTVTFQFSFWRKTKSKSTILKTCHGQDASENGEVQLWISTSPEKPGSPKRKQKETQVGLSREKQKLAKSIESDLDRRSR